MLKNKIILLVAFLTSIFLAACSSGGGGFFGGGGNAGPPEWQAGSPEADVMDSTAFVISRLNKQGTVYCVAIPRGNDAPSPRQVQDGTDSDDTAVPNGSAPTDNDNFSSLKIIGLTYSTHYDVYCVAEDTTSRLQAAATKIEISTNERNTLFVSDSSGDDANDGSIEHPKKTIGAAAAAPTPGIIRISVSAGTYNESVTIGNGRSLYGGFSATDWSDSNVVNRNNSKYKTSIEGNDSCAVTFTGSPASSSGWRLQGFVIESKHSDISRGVCVNIDAGKLLIDNNTIKGGSGSTQSAGIYIDNIASNTNIFDNDINGGTSSGGHGVGNSTGIFIKEAGTQAIYDNSINGGSGNASSRGILIQYPLSSDSKIYRNNISSGSSSSISYGIDLRNTQNGSSLEVVIHGNYITSNTNGFSYGINASSSDPLAKAQPRIFNNVMEITQAGIDAYAMSFDFVSGTPLVYNNTIIVRSVSTSGDAYGIFANSHHNVDRPTNADIKNNIFVCQPESGRTISAIRECDSPKCASVNIQNNSFFGCTYIFNSGSNLLETINELNTFRPGSTGNIIVDPLLSASPEYDLTAASPTAVTQGGQDLSGVLSFPENISGDSKIDKRGTARTAPWSMGAYERD